MARTTRRPLRFAVSTALLVAPAGVGCTSKSDTHVNEGPFEEPTKKTPETPKEDPRADPPEPTVNEGPVPEPDTDPQTPPVDGEAEAGAPELEPPPVNTAPQKDPPPSEKRVNTGRVKAPQ